jgi:hypothetical protein
MKFRQVVLVLVLLLMAMGSVWPQSSVESRVWWAWFPLEAIDENGEVNPLEIVRGQGDFSRLVFPPDVSVRLLTFQAPSNIVTARTLPATPAGSVQTSTDFEVWFDDTPDDDEDNLGELAELVTGTDPNDPDSDGDGIPDGVEIDLGTDPMDGRPTVIGIVGSLDAGGNITDLAIRDGVMAMVDTVSGNVLLASVFNGMEPVLIGEVDVPGSARAAALYGDRLAVAEGIGGVSVYDIGDPGQAFHVASLGLSGQTVAVAASGPLAVAGATGGEIGMMDLRTGQPLGKLQVTTASGGVHDVAIGYRAIYAATRDGVVVIPLLPGLQLGTPSLVAVSSSDLGVGQIRLRLFLATDQLYLVRGRGYAVLDVTDPAAPLVLNEQLTPQLAWQHMIAWSQDRGLVGMAPLGSANAWLFDLSDSDNNNLPLLEIETPGSVAAVAAYNGLGYVADRNSGVQVINFLPPDVGGVAPTVEVAAGDEQGRVEEGQLLFVDIAAVDEFAVRFVDILVNDERVITDGSFPYGAMLVAPTLAENGPELRVRALAHDLGGNVGESNELVLELIEDATPPFILHSSPEAGAVLFSGLDGISLAWSETIDTASLSQSNLSLRSAGPDGQLDTVDDELIEITLSYREALQTVVVRSADTLAPGLYAVDVDQVSDLAGNVMDGSFRLTFRILGLSVDSDGDGVPDDVEIHLLGTDPFNPDTSGNGISDGDEDFDGDGLSNRCEILADTDPTLPDTSGNGVTDNDEDPDLDGLTNADECAVGTDPLVNDTDSDGWPDGAEVDGGSDPLSANSVPLLFAGKTGPLLKLVRPGMGDSGDLDSSTVAGGPPLVTVVRPGESTTGEAPSTFVARPPRVSLVRPGEGESQEAASTVIANPPVEIDREAEN